MLTYTSDIFSLIFDFSRGTLGHKLKNVIRIAAVNSPFSQHILDPVPELGSLSRCMNESLSMLYDSAVIHSATDQFSFNFHTIFIKINCTQEESEGMIIFSG